MSDYLIELENVCKKYGQQDILKDVTFQIKRGEICGLVGENGAGKTTLIRILSGLIKADHGRIKGRQECNSSSIIEAPALYPMMSAYENLHYMALKLGIKDSQTRISEILALVGLADVDRRKKVKNYSLGMRQRLAIGMSIIDYPDFLMLDEPINGLDPAGIKEMRKIISTLREQYGITILISSHILSELDLVVDRYVILHQGHVLKLMDREALQSAFSKKILLSTNQNDLACRLLQNYDKKAILQQDYIALSEDSLTVMQIIDLLRDNEIEIYEIFKQSRSFEDYYLDLLDEGGDSSC